MNATKPIAALGALGVALAIATAAGAGSTRAGGEMEDQFACTLPQGSERVHLDPADFTTRIDNPYWPMKLGSRWIYRETNSEGARQKVVVTVTPRTKRMANGVTARVVHDAVTNGTTPAE